ncbi:MAG: TetR/AcrR family transcriptional regulator [Ruminococcus sp.]|nr:TetR/AcrR family transcriptional regulator [Ruminococcus sp.]
MGTQDRRIRKTRAVLKNALLSLMKEKSVKHITVKELCDRADINRGTFYLHYADVFDMLEKIEDDMFSELNEYIEMAGKNEEALSESLFKNIFSFVKENSEFCSVMLSDRGEIGFIKKLLTFLHDKFTSRFGDTPLTELYFSFIVYGFIGLIETWLNTGMNETPEDMAVICEKIIQNKIREQL